MAEQPQSLFEPESNPPPSRSTSEELVGLRARLTQQQEARPVHRRLPWAAFAALGLVLVAAVIGVVNWVRTPGASQQAAAPAAADVVPPPPQPDPAATKAAAPPGKGSVPRAASRPALAKPRTKTPAEPPPAVPVSEVVTPTPAAEPPVYVVTTADRRGVDTALERYRDGVAKLDAAAVRAIWPSANPQDLAREFGQLREQQVELHSCDLDIKETIAAATCTGVAGNAQKIGTANLRYDDRRWVFTLKRTGDDWIIQNVVIR
jgi:hypothetical protein